MLKVALCNRSQTDATVEIVHADGIFWYVSICICIYIHVYRQTD
jgi:hypothetical protein